MLKEFLAWKSDYIKISGNNCSDAIFLDICKNQFAIFQSKGDYAHQQITTSAILAQRLDRDGFKSNFGALKTDNKEEVFWSNKKVVEKAGWLGDATLKPISFGPEDYIADLDSQNIVTYMTERNLSYPKAANQYYNDLSAGQSRAALFLETIQLKDVKNKIFNDLVYQDTERQMRAASRGYDVKRVEKLGEMYEESNAMEKIKTEYPDTYQFIKNLEAENHTMETMP